MRAQGKICEWKDRQGFGFILSDNDDNKVFVHQSAFENRKRKPAEGVLVTYDVKLDENRRIRADKVTFVIDSPASVIHLPTKMLTTEATGLWSAGFLFLFLIFLVAASLTGRFPAAITGLYFCASLITFLIYALDKSAARSGQWRTQESTLHFLALIGGWPGGLLAQKILRHKSKKREFQIVFWTTVVMNCIVLAWMFGENGKALLRKLL